MYFSSTSLQTTQIVADGDNVSDKVNLGVGTYTETPKVDRGVATGSKTLDTPMVMLGLEKVETLLNYNDETTRSD